MTTKRSKKNRHFLSSLPFDVAMEKLLLFLCFVSFVRHMTLVPCLSRIITRIHGLKGLAMADLSRISEFSWFYST